MNSLLKLPIKLRNRHFFLLDLIVLAVIPLFALTLRVEDLQALPPYTCVLTLYTLITLVVRLIIFWQGGIYRRYWRYASTEEIALIGQVALYIVIANVLLFIALQLLAKFPLPLSSICIPSLPRSLPIIDGMLLLIYLGGTRFLVRLAEHSEQNKHNGGKRTLIIGAGDAGCMIAREMKSNPQLGLQPIGFIDDDSHKKGIKIQDLPVFGGQEDFLSVIQAHKPEQAIIAMPTVAGKIIRNYVNLCEQADLDTKTIPGIYELISGRVSVNQVRDVGIEDLLRRDPVCLDGSELAPHFADATVLVTGAGGSIGSELCRQIGAYAPRRLVLLGHGENSIYHVYSELTQRLPDVEIVPVIADIRDRSRLNTLFDRHQPDIVFHAAAHKHVPLMEKNVVEAVTNNILGTRAVLQASISLTSPASSSSPPTKPSTPSTPWASPSASPSFWCKI